MINNPQLSLSTIQGQPKVQPLLQTRITLPVSCVVAPLGWWAQICRLKNSTISSLRAALGLISAQTYSTEGRSSSPRWHTLIRQFMAADLKKMLRAETRCSKTAKCFSCLKQKCSINWCTLCSRQIRMMLVKVFTWHLEVLWRRSWTECRWIHRSACSNPAPPCGWLCSPGHGWWTSMRCWRSHSTSPKDLRITKIDKRGLSKLIRQDGITISDNGNNTV